MAGLLLGLLGYVGAMAVVGPQVLRTCGRVTRSSPRFGLVLWTVTVSSWVVAVLAAGLASIAQLTDGHGLAALLRACIRAVTVLGAPTHPAEAAAALALVCSSAFLVRLGVVVARHVRETRRGRRLHRKSMGAVAGTTRRQLGRVTVLESDTLAAYCLPGREHAIVVTRGTLNRLSAAETQAVLAHEDAHLRGRHHLWVGWATVLARAFGFVPLLRSAPIEVARLVEWIADDRAARCHGDRTVARALAVMATNGGPARPDGRAVSGPGRSAPQPLPAGTPSTGTPSDHTADVVLTAAGGDVSVRVRRLLSRRPVAGLAYGRGSVVLVVAVAALVVAGSLLLPATTADPGPMCSTPSSVTEFGR